MKKVLYIGDNHGRTDWIKWAKEAINKGMDVVFLGDYFDSFVKSGSQIVDNFQAIVGFKKKYDRRKIKVPTRPTVTLLLGNHDYSYMMHKTNTSGYNIHFDQQYRDLLNKHWDLFDLAWGYENPDTKQYTLATHAGITKTYWDRYIADAKYQESHYGFIEKIVDDPWKTNNMHNVLNILKDKFGLLWKIGDYRGGVDLAPSMIWADFNELKVDPYPNINQIVGHSAWHSQEIHFNTDGTFLAKVDSFDKDSARLIINL